MKILTRMGMVIAGSASGIVISIGISPRHMSRAVRLVCGAVGASIGAMIGAFYGIKGRPLLLL